MSKIRAGVIGVGHMGKEHARVYAELANAELTGVFDVDKENGQKIAQKNKSRYFASVDDLLKECDVLSIATPTTYHYDVAMTCIGQGKHILIEKPLANNTEEATRLVKAAQEKGVILQVGHIERFNPVLKALEERLTQPRFIEAHRLSPYPARSTDIGVVMDLMIHDLEIILHLVKSPIHSIDAVGIPVLSKGEDIANARIRFENGCVANITTSRISPEKMRKIRVFQEDAYLSLDYQKQEGEIYRKLDSKIIRESIAIVKEEPLKRQLQSFVDCVISHGSPIVSGLQASNALKVATQIMDLIWEKK